MHIHGCLNIPCETWQAMDYHSSPDETEVYNWELLSGDKNPKLWNCNLDDGLKLTKYRSEVQLPTPFGQTT